MHLYQKSTSSLTFSRVITAFLFAVIAGCGTVEINSEPREAEIFVLGPGQDKGRPLGKTPFQGALSDMTDIAGEGPLVIQLRKQGYLPQSIFVPNVSGSDLKISLVLPSAKSDSQFTEINRIVRIALRAEREILEKRFDAAMASAQEIRKINENATSSYEIEGAVFLLKGQLEKSLSSWQKSLAIEPQNADALGMVNLIEKKLGRTPAR